MDCEVIYRSGDYAFRYHRNFFQWPQDAENRAVCGIACKDGLVYAATRAKKYPICVFTTEGAFVKGRGTDLEFKRSHGISIEPDGTIWVCDDQNSVVYHMDDDGRLLEQMGEKGVFSDSGYDPTVRWPHDLYTNVRAAEPFNRPTRWVRAPWGDYYCTDGYGNTAVHRFSPEKKLIRTIGGPGWGHGQFRLPHSLEFDTRDRIWVCDRENFRIQIFDKNCEFLHCISRLGRPSEVWQHQGKLYVCEEDGLVSIYNEDFEREAVIGYESCFTRIHSIGGDESGSLYLGRIEGEDSLFKLEKL